MTMTQEVTFGPNLSRIRPTYGYYRQPNGWVKPAVVTAMEELKYRREGWVPLPQYGRFDMGTSWAADHPLELLFVMDGAKELCEEQIRQQGLFMNPPLVPTCRQGLTQLHRQHDRNCWIGAKPVEFPQVAHMTDLGPFLCRFCDRKLPTTEARSQHEGVMHKDEKSDIRTGETLAACLIEGLRPVAAPTVAAAPVTTGSATDAQLMRLAQLEAADLARLEKQRVQAKKYTQNRKNKKKKVSAEAGG